MKLSCWTNIALTNGQNRKLVIAQDVQFGYIAILDFGDLGARIGGPGRTPEKALAELESALMEDAAEEMVKSGTV